ncbi:MAG: hypothetical protein WC966_09280 [Bradymonadales bacterium]|jgi:TM2 domain-containing membrane protein YozV
MQTKTKQGSPKESLARKIRGFAYIILGLVIVYLAYSISHSVISGIQSDSAVDPFALSASTKPQD